jgi:DNA-binding MarR family transcriptional regulator
MEDPLRSLPGYALRRASAAMMARLAERMEALGVRTTEATILMLIAANPGISQSMLGRMLDIQRPNMTPLAGRLEERGLIKRTRSDGRSFGLALTQAGAKLEGQVRVAAQAHEDEIWGLIPDAHHAHLLPALHALWDATS